MVRGRGLYSFEVGSIYQIEMLQHPFVVSVNYYKVCFTMQGPIVRAGMTKVMDRQVWQEWVIAGFSKVRLGLGHISLDEIRLSWVESDGLHPGVNFTNILRAAFSYESFLRSFYVLTIWVCNFLAKGFWRKSCS